MQLAGMDGYETANRLRSSGVEAPVIALSAEAFEGARDLCLAAGCDDYLSKPAEPARQYECVNGWLDHRRRGDGNSPSSRPPAQAHCDILIVDDSTDGCEAMRDLLEIAGFRVSTATDEQSASERLRSACPRAVILDLNLGDSSGIALAQHLRNNPTTSRMTVLGLSGRARAELAADDSRLFDAYLQKPANLDSVLRSLADCGIEPDPDQT
jgi:CheY-like chemotaxis protein